MIKSEFIEQYTTDIFFFLTHYYGGTHCLMYTKVELVCLCICHQLSFFYITPARYAL